jgi:CubicO group peptidase (beta-lactamase class C family)
MSVDPIVDLLEVGRLQSNVAKLFPRQADHNIFVGITVHGEHRFAAADATSPPALRNERLGCITKLATAALIREAIANRLLSLESRLDAFLREAPAGRAVAGITMRDLINHTHGLDDSHVERLPLNGDHSIDWRSLCASLLRVERIGPPGGYYSYGHAGAWLGAAVLESIYEQPYAQVLEARLVEPLGMTPNVAAGSLSAVDMPALCPALGGPLSLTCEDMLRFLDHHLTCADLAFCGRDLSDLLGDAVRLPGWHSTERGVFFGWKYYGHGWFGHNSQIPRAGLLIRMNPVRQIGIVVASGRQPPARVARSLFRECLPDLITLEMPRLRPERNVPLDEAHRFVGEYRNCSMSVSIVLTESSDLELHVRGAKSLGEHKERGLASLLRPAERDIFFLQNNLPEMTPYIQFLSDNNSAAEGVWNGMHVFPRR